MFEAKAVPNQDNSPVPQLRPRAKCCVLLTAKMVEQIARLCLHHQLKECKENTAVVTFSRGLKEKENSVDLFEGKA